MFIFSPDLKIFNGEKRMRFHVMTLFPEMVEQGLSNSITGRALKEKIISLNCVNIRDYCENRYGKVDDYSYGGGAGMLIQAEPVYDCYRSLMSDIPNSHKKRVIYVTPQGRPFRQEMAEELAQNDDLIFLCGHYEGIDERVLEEIVTDHVSIGDYVLTGGELPAMVMIDSISRLVDGVLGNDSSAEIESFHGKLLEYPQYTRPEVWHGKAVPAVLLSGDAARIESWRKEESIKRTRERRGDLYQDYCRLVEAEKMLARYGREYADLRNLLRQGCGELVRRDGNRLLMRNRKDHCYYFANLTMDPLTEALAKGDKDTAAFFEKTFELTKKQTDSGIHRLVLHDTNELKDAGRLMKIFRLTEARRMVLLVYTPRERPGNARIRALKEKLADRVHPELISFIEQGIVAGLKEGMMPVCYLNEEERFPAKELEAFGIYRTKRPVLVLS